MKKIAQIIFIFILFTNCIFKQKEKNIKIDLKNSSISMCDNTIIKRVTIYKNDLFIGEYILNENSEGSNEIFFSKLNDGYKQTDKIYFNDKDSKYSISIPKSDLVYQIDLHTNSEAKIDSIFSYNLCEPVNSCEVKHVKNFGNNKFSLFYHSASPFQTINPI